MKTRPKARLAEGLAEAVSPGIEFLAVSCKIIKCIFSLEKH
jgi:hypothetical protein